MRSPGRRTAFAAAVVLFSSLLAERAALGQQQDLAGLQDLERGAAPYSELVGAHERARVRPAAQALTPLERGRLEAVLGNARSDDERAVIFKAVATKNSLDDIEWLAREIQGHSRPWLLAKTTLSLAVTGEALIQQFTHSCGPAVLEALWALYDPVYALRTHALNRDVHLAHPDDPASVNGPLAEEQRLLLERPATHGGVAVPRNGAGGSGRWITDLLENPDTRRRTGMSYSYRRVSDWRDGFALLDGALERGHAVPLVVGAQAGATSHYILATGRRVVAGLTGYQFYDPWEGRTQWLTQEDLVAGRAPPHAAALSGVHEPILPGRFGPSGPLGRLLGARPRSPGMSELLGRVGEATGADAASER